jgi:hypothetical protein
MAQEGTKVKRGAVSELLPEDTAVHIGPPSGTAEEECGRAHVRALEFLAQAASTAACSRH